MRVQVNGRRWRLRFGRPGKNTHGLCDEPDAPDKEILVDRKLAGRVLLETVIHELLHAGVWHLSEDCVEQVGVDIAAVLWRMGYRRKGEE